MPTLEVVSIQDAQLELSLTGKRGAIVRQYIDYIGRLESGQAGKLIPDAGETTAAIRRRLDAAALCTLWSPTNQPLIGSPPRPAGCGEEPSYTDDPPTSIPFCRHTPFASSVHTTALTQS